MYKKLNLAFHKRGHFQQGDKLEVCPSHLVSRAPENQRFLISSNNAHITQHCLTMLIDPNGDIIEEVLSDKLWYFRKEIKINQASNWYINQRRNDIVKLINGKSEITIKQLQRYIKEKDFNPELKQGYFLKLIEEVGELSEVVRKDRRLNSSRNYR